MRELSCADLIEIEGGARIGDRRVNEALEFGRVDELRRLIRRNRSEIESYGEIFVRTGAGGREVSCQAGEKPLHGIATGVSRQFDGKPSPRTGGRPMEELLLTEEQALLVCMFARTPRAAAARRRIITVFVEWRRGGTPARPRHVAERIGDAEAVNQLSLIATHLPIWSTKRRPWWWDDFDVRSYVIASHRQMTLEKCFWFGVQRFGLSRMPGISNLSDFWQRLDRLYVPSPEGRARRREAKYLVEPGEAA